MNYEGLKTRAEILPILFLILVTMVVKIARSSLVSLIERFRLFCAARISSPYKQVEPVIGFIQLPARRTRIY